MGRMACRKPSWKKRREKKRKSEKNSKNMQIMILRKQSCAMISWLWLEIKGIIHATKVKFFQRKLTIGSDGTGTILSIKNQEVCFGKNSWLEAKLKHGGIKIWTASRLNKKSRRIGRIWNLVLKLSAKILLIGMIKIKNRIFATKELVKSFQEMKNQRWIGTGKLLPIKRWRNQSQWERINSRLDLKLKTQTCQTMKETVCSMLWTTIPKIENSLKMSSCSWCHQRNSMQRLNGTGIRIARIRIKECHFRNSGLELKENRVKMLTMRRQKKCSTSAWTKTEMEDSQKRSSCQWHHQKSSFRSSNGTGNTLPKILWKEWPLINSKLEVKLKIQILQMISSERLSIQWM